MKENSKLNRLEKALLGMIVTGITFTGVGGGLMGYASKLDNEEKVQSRMDIFESYDGNHPRLYNCGQMMALGGLVLAAISATGSYDGKGIF